MGKVQLLLCLILSLLASCGPKKILAKYADTYIQHQVEKRLPLYSAQEEKLSKEIDHFLNDHKERVKKILPILEKVDFNRAASLDEQYPKFSEAYLEIASNFSTILARHMSVFDQKQKKEFLKKLKIENDEIFARDREERRHKIASRVEHLLGSLTKDQRRILKNNQKVFDDQVVARSERRSKLHNEFKSILDQEISPAAKEKMIYEAFVRNQQEAMANTTNIEIAKTFVPTLTTAQKKFLKGRLSEIREMLGYFLDTVY